MASITNNFNALKNKNPGMTDDEAMKQAMALTAKSRTRFRKASKAKAASKKPNWASRLKSKVKKTLKSRHSKAGKAYKEKMKSGKGRGY
ncbi:hypothetical protein LCGC14_0577780 [marine sediment metagenome]|uniref:Uncharacterized protein n=1 Tax=marine sediment metagenome TaxID=412755 RepID=A0A0F9S0X1_9ZZZZ